MAGSSETEGGPGWPDLPRASRWQALWSRFWTLPLTIALSSLALGLVVPLLDASLDENAPGWVFEGGVDGARSVLGTVAGAMISVTGLVFSITMVVLQLASSQFSPRILGTFLESRVVQATLGAFTGSFLYALAVLRAVRGTDSGGAPQLAVTLASLYVVVAVGLFLAFIHHITNSVRVAQVMAQVREQAIAASDRLHGSEPETTWSPSPATAAAELRNDDRAGYVTALARDALVSAARSLDAVVDLELTPGDHVLPGQRLGRVWGVRDLPDQARDALRAAVHLASERDLRVDVGYGLRHLVDIADRALSPGVNDPTTALQALAELHVVLQVLAQRPDPTPYLVDDGTVVAIYRPRRFGEQLAQVTAELQHYGADSVRVVPELRRVLESLAQAALPRHRSAVEAVLASLPG